MVGTAELLTIAAFLSFLLALVKLWMDVRKARSDNETLSQGLAALYSVVESNQQVVESLMAQQRQTAASAEAQLALARNRLELERLKAVGGVFRFLMENSDE